MEIELTDAQLEKVNELQANGISVGDAIDMLFEMKEKAIPEIESIDKELGIFDKIKYNAMDVENKSEVLDENYGEADKTYELKVQDVKHKISWARGFFKF